MTRRSLFRDERGATLLEFAFVAPVMLILIMGLGELAYESYVQSVLIGAMQKAGRDSGLESNATSNTTIDTQVENTVLGVAPKATFTNPAPTRVNYDSFNNVGQPEKWTDTDNDGKCDHGETYVDSNNNGQWDADSGGSGQGGANDVVVYTVTAKYPRLFALGWLGMDSLATAASTTTLKNQPYSSQKAPGTGTCT